MNDTTININNNLVNDNIINNSEIENIANIVNISDTKKPIQKTIFLKDYTPPHCKINHIDLFFDLDVNCTIVASTIFFEKND